MDNRVLFGIMTIIFNSIGVPCFMAGKVKTGILRIVLGIVSCGIISIINEIMGIIQGIKILCMSDEEFAEDEFRVATERTVSLAVALRSQEALNEQFERLTRRAPKQYAALLEVAERVADESFAGEVRCRTLQADAAALKALADKGLIEFHERERAAEFGSDEECAALPTLSEAQTEALRSIEEQHSAKRCVLLHGVTGSGKTEIYIHLIHKHIYLLYHL